MGSFVFTWDHPATEVYVTGTFDDWSKSVKLDKSDGSLHSKNVDLPNADEKIYYKFVVDGNWTTDHTAPTETDSSGNTNNVLTPENISKADTGSSDLPGAFPETPAAGMQEVSVNPLPATAGVGNPISTKAGEGLPPTSEITSNNIDSAVTLDKASYENSGSGAPQLPNVVTPEAERGQSGAGLFGLPEKAKNMIPESSLPIVGGGPINTFQSSGAGTTTAALAGEVPKEPRGVPEVVSDSQEKAGAEPEAAANPEAVAEKSAVENELEKTVPEAPATSESTISGKAAGIAGGAVAGASAAVAGAAAYVQSGKATEDAKASLPESVQKQLPEGGVSDNLPSTTTVTDKLPTTSSVTDSLPSTTTVTDKLPESVKNTVASNGSTTAPTAIASTVPDPVQESISESHQAPEAAANAEAVDEKAAVESELLQKVPKEQATGEPAPEPETAPASSGAYVIGSTSLGQAAPSTGPTPIASSVPDTVQESISEAHTSPEAATSSTAVQEKSAVESELLSKVAPENSAGTPAPESTETAAISATAPSTGLKSTEAPLAPEGLKSTEAPLVPEKPSEPTAPDSSKMTEIPPLTDPRESRPSAMASALSETKSKGPDSRDISPMTRPDGSRGPVVTTGVGSSSTPQKSTAAAPASPASAADSDKKAKRRSGFFGKLKEKLHHKKDDK